MRIAFLRHGLTQWNLRRRIQGRTDIPLSETGRQQVRNWRLPAQLEPAPCYVSPLRRARETAALMGCDDVRVEPRLIEMHWGDWEGELPATLRARLGDSLRDNEARGLDFRPPGGESPRDVQARVLQWCAELSHVEGEAIAVTHKGVIRAVYAAATDWNMHGPPAHKLDWECAHIFDVPHGGSVRVHAVNVSLR